ncbi:MAG: type II 3-dehydroquinate dehydratase [Rhodobacteraceae bacterium]|nr:type II 3-dehydroquinate dehydratase [Paracoccaceae bacterium]
MSQPMIHILNGPNLNLLGSREPDIYGHDSLDDIARDCAALGATLGVQCALMQTNHEGELVGMIQSARDQAQGIIINPAAYTHTSVAILDALSAFDGPVIEVHLSNIHKREAFRHHSYVSARADAVIAGCGALGYELALRQMARMLGRDHRA